MGEGFGVGICWRLEVGDFGIGYYIGVGIFFEVFCNVQKPRQVTAKST